MMTVTPTRTGLAGLPASWWTAVRRALRRRPGRPTAQAPAPAAMPRGLRPPAPLAPEMRSEEDLRAAWRLWFGGNPIGKL